MMMGSLDSLLFTENINYFRFFVNLVLNDVCLASMNMKISRSSRMIGDILSVIDNVLFSDELYYYSIDDFLFFI